MASDLTPSPAELNQYSSVAMEAALLAGKAILAIYERFDPADTQYKQDASPLTEADLAADKIIADHLVAAFPHIPLISEETSDPAYAFRQDWPLSWLVDPLDGTKEFLRKNGEFTVNIALLLCSKVIAGIVAAPVRDELFWAGKGLGAWRIHAGETQQLHVSNFSRLDSGLRIVASRSHRDAETEAFIASHREPVIRAMGSSLKIVLLAAGDADIYPRFAPTMEWDTAAAQIILEEAGGLLVEAETAKPLRYNKPDRHNPFFIAYGGCSDCLTRS
jgi:3'(2'), 5'-bisphosphate nucleotidase